MGKNKGSSVWDMRETNSSRLVHFANKFVLFFHIYTEYGDRPGIAAVRNPRSRR